MTTKKYFLDFREQENKGKRESETLTDIDS